jgi:hypothetical protein
MQIWQIYFVVRVTHVGGDVADLTAIGSVNVTGCDQGQMIVAALGSCANCSAGRYTDELNANQCKPCPIGKYGATTGATTCSLCPTGEEALTNGSVSCVPCTAGRFQNTSGQCQDCPSGSFQEEASRTSCISCAVGRSAFVAASVQCQPCSPGRYAASNGSVSCTSCPNGTYGAGEELFECTACPNGTGAAYEGAVQCIACSPGRFQMKGLCVECPQGSYQGRAGQVGNALYFQHGTQGATFAKVKHHVASATLLRDAMELHNVAMCNGGVARGFVKEGLFHVCWSHTGCALDGIQFLHGFCARHPACPSAHGHTRRSQVWPGVQTRDQQTELCL